jgi:hypothetical protein
MRVQFYAKMAGQAAPELCTLEVFSDEIEQLSKMPLEHLVDRMHGHTRRIWLMREIPRNQTSGSQAFRTRLIVGECEERGSIPRFSGEFEPRKARSSLKKFEKKVEDKTLVVVAEIKRDDCWLATAYYEF